jgi:tRNA A-37 threonylcarbamoyl transferase component Bud32
VSPQQRWNRIQELCEQAENRPQAEREAFLAAAERDAAIRAEVLDLLRALASEQNVRSDVAAGAADAPPGSPALLPERIGPYRVTGLLGRGGTSTVYAAERETEGVTSSVAVKVLHAYLLDDESTARFQREQRILAGLDHPALCRVLDAGITADRQPFLVIERVDGQPIDDYASEHRLSLADRIRLVISAAEAVGAVHRNFVAHLDLKPSNLFVTVSGQVRLLDFGTAKLLDPAGNLTTTRHLTPVYASPEQLRGDPVTMASDIYSLGLILYELLAGASPHSGASLMSLAERASGVTSTGPMASKVTEAAATERGLTETRLRRLLSGDIERVVAKALAPEPDRRYATIGELADDLRRYLEDRPVLARRQTTGYRLKKYAARNRGGLTVTLVLVAGLLAAGGYALWQQHQAIEAGRRAQVSANFLFWLIGSSNPLYGGSADMTVLALVNRAEERLRRGDVLDRESSLGMETILGSFMFNAGQQQRGAALARDAFEQARRSDNARTLLLASTTLGGMLLSQGDCPGAVKVFQEGDAALARRRSSIPAWEQISFLVSRDQVKGNCEQDLSGRLTADALALLPTVSDTNTELGVPVRIWKALVYNGSARALLQQKKLAESRQAAEMGLQLAAQEPDGRNIRIALLQTRAAVEYLDKNVAAAANSLEEAATLAEGSAAPFDAIRLKVMAGTRLAEAGQKTRALELADQALTQAALHSSEIAQTKWMILIDAAFTYFNADHCEKVAPLLKEADTLTGGKMPPQWKGNRLAVESMCLAQSGKTAEAKVVGAEALAAAGATWNSSSSLRKKIEAIVAETARKK